MKLIVGLGNPGEKYKNNRHNLGFIILDKVISEGKLKWSREEKLLADIATNNDVLYVKPQTFMNNSGDCVSKLLNFYKIPIENLSVIHDDVDLDLCQIKTQKMRGSAGHKGVESIINVLKTNDFTRIRVGVGKPDNPNIDTQDWVLMDFTDEELNKIKHLSITLP